MKQLSLKLAKSLARKNVFNLDYFYLFSKV